MNRCGCQYTSMGVKAKGMLRGCQGESSNFRIPGILSVFNKNSTLNRCGCHYTCVVTLLETATLCEESYHTCHHKYHVMHLKCDHIGVLTQCAHTVTYTQTFTHTHTHVHTHTHTHTHTQAHTYTHTRGSFAFSEALPLCLFTSLSFHIFK